MKSVASVILNVLRQVLINQSILLDHIEYTSDQREIDTAKENSAFLIDEIDKTLEDK